MNLQSKQSQQLRQKLDALKVQVVSSELDLAITFWWLATTTDDQTKAHRNIANAKRAYDSAASLMHGSLDSAQNLEIREKLIRLHSMMAGCDRDALFVSQ